MSETFRFKGVALLQDTICFGAGFSEDGEAVTLMFDNLILNLEGTRNRGLARTQAASVVIPVESEQDLSVRLHLDGFVSSEAGARAVLLVNHAGKTALVNVSEGACKEAAFSQTVCSMLPAGVDYKMTLFLLVERNSATPEVGVSLHVDSAEVVLARLNSKEW